jgi:hypothetical protein
VKRTLQGAGGEFDDLDELNAEAEAEGKPTEEDDADGLL